MPDPKAAHNEAAKRRADEWRTQAAMLFERGRGNDLPGVAGTLWAVYNAVAELVDHGESKRTPAHRLTSIWFGSGATLKNLCTPTFKKKVR